MRSPAGPLADHLVRAGRPSQTDGRHVNMPIELGSTIVFDTLAAFEAARDARYQTGTLYYGRYGTEASFQLERTLETLEGAAGVTLTSSGVAAISLTLLSFARPGGHLLVADNVYGNTRAFCDRVLSAMDMDIEYFDPMLGHGLSQLLRPDTCAVMFEAPGSGTFEVPDIPAIAQAARDHGVPAVIDSTWATPVFCRPLLLGVDVVVASCSKYVGGHSDCMLGMIASTQAHHERIRQTVMAIGDKTGGQDVFLALRGLRTLKIRMEAIDAAARDIAAWLGTRSEVKCLLHPAFASCPGHGHWARDFSGAAGLFGVVFHGTGRDHIRAFVDALDHFGIGVSWGGYESLVLPVTPVRTATHWPSEDTVIRFNIGLEDPDTLKADLSAALHHLHA